MSVHPHSQATSAQATSSGAVWSTILLGVILIGAAALRFFQLDGSSLWSDEGNTWALLSRSFAQIAHDAAADIHPPGYYWLLKLWCVPFGASAASMRAFSALLGLLLVYLIYQIGRRLPLTHRATTEEWPARIAALLAAVSPFQIYYSQEARMYLLLTVAGAGLMLALLVYLRREWAGLGSRGALWGYVTAGVVGLWTHYTFPIVLMAAGMGYLLELRRSVPAGRRLRSLCELGVANGIILLLYLPWLPTAIARVFAWPAGGVRVPWSDGVQLTLTTLLVGPRQTLPTPHWLWLGLGLLLPFLGLAALRRSQGAYLLLFWWLLPIGLMFGLGLFSDAFLKFLLTASPAWLLLMAIAPTRFPWPRLGMGMVATGGVALAAVVLPQYYSDPAVRDNYAGVAAYIAAVADPQQDLVILNAPGQQEVWHYYDPGVPILALPAERPADRTATIATLTAAAADRRNIYALFWATAEADPERIVEQWLDEHGFKGLERWQGNLRFVIYTLPTALDCEPASASGPLQWGETIRLESICRTPAEEQIAPGEAALLGLAWQATAPINTRYKVSVQLLNAHHLVVEQHDGEPVGGSRPTDTWQPGESIVDNHGIVLPIGTPPGIYRLIVALYDANTGARLPVIGQGLPDGSDYAAVGDVHVVLPDKPLPAALAPVQYAINQELGPLYLVGYSAFRQGFGHDPQTALAAGDPVEFIFVWQAPSPLPATWPLTTAVTLTVGDEQITFAPAGDDYPLAQWSAGELVRYSVLLPYDGSAKRPRLQIGDASLRLRSLPLQ